MNDNEKLTGARMAIGGDMDNERLLPCPFCGSNAKIIHDGGTCIEDGKSSGILWFVGCTKCPAVMGEVSKDAIIAAWNRRA